SGDASADPEEGIDEASIACCAAGAGAARCGAIPEPHGHHADRLSGRRAGRHRGADGGREHEAALSRGSRGRQPSGGGGGGGAVAGAVGELTRAAPDGYTIILTPHSALTIAPQINDLPYKTPDDYDPFINLVAYYPLIAVRTESKYKTIRELLSDAKDNPG